MERKKQMFRRKKKTYLEPIKEIQQELAHTRARIETVQNNFQNVLDPDLIDSYIYESNAAWKRYHFLLRQIRQLTSVTPSSK